MARQCLRKVRSPCLLRLQRRLRYGQRFLQNLQQFQRTVHQLLLRIRIRCQRSMPRQQFHQSLLSLWLEEWKMCEMLQWKLPERQRWMPCQRSILCYFQPRHPHLWCMLQRVLSYKRYLPASPCRYQHNPQLCIIRQQPKLPKMFQSILPIKEQLRWSQPTLQDLRLLQRKLPLLLQCLHLNQRHLRA